MKPRLIAWSNIGPLTTRSHSLTPLRDFEYCSGQPAKAAGDAVQEKDKVICKTEIV